MFTIDLTTVKLKLNTAGKYCDQDILVTNKMPAVVEVTTESEMDAALVEANAGNVYKFTGTTTTKYIQNDLYVVEVE